jgi:hypothetical protein
MTVGYSASRATFDARLLGQIDGNVTATRRRDESNLSDISAKFFCPDILTRPEIERRFFATSMSQQTKSVRGVVVLHCSIASLRAAGGHIR